MKKKKLAAEPIYLIALIVSSFGTAISVRANLGISALVTPAYVLFRIFSQNFSFLTYGMFEYTYQFLFIVVMLLIIKKFKLSYLWTIVSALIYSGCLDLWTFLLSFIEANPIWLRFILMFISLFTQPFCAALILHSYITPLIYEMFCKEVSNKLKIKFSNLRLGLDIGGLVIAATMSLLAFGLWHFEGIGIGTVLAALTMGPLVKFFTEFLDQKFEFIDLLPFRKYFDK